jgi:integrase
MRSPKPWFWKPRKCWCAYIDGKRVILSKTDDFHSAQQNLYRLLLDENRKKDIAKKPWTERTIRDLYYDFYEEKKEVWGAATDRNCTYVFNNFICMYGDTLVGDFRVGHFLKWIKRKECSESTNVTMFILVKSLFGWATVHHIDRSPFEGVENPFVMANRKRILSDEEYQRVLIVSERYPQFNLFIRVLRASGCRPGELRTVQAADLHPTEPMITLEKHKTRKKTDKSRVIIVPDDLMIELRNEAKIYPTGAILRNSKGTSWSKDNITAHFRRIRIKANLEKPEEVSLYTLRHSFATEAVLKIPLTTASKMLGHSNVSTTMRYCHTEEKSMIEAMRTLNASAS